MARTPGAHSTASQAPMTQRVWQSMRVMRQFTSADLMATAEAGETVVQKYLKALCATGFVRIVVPRVSGRPGSRDVYGLARNSGPLAPIRHARDAAVFDPNTWLTWGPGSALVKDARPPAEYELSLAEREALVYLAQGLNAKASVQVLHRLARAGLVRLEVQLTTNGKALAAQMPAARSQRDDGRSMHFTGQAAEAA